MDKTIPVVAQKYVWGDDLSQLNWADHRLYITQTLLNKADGKAIAWLLNQASKRELLEDLPKLKLNPLSENFWRIYLS